MNENITSDRAKIREKALKELYAAAESDLDEIRTDFGAQTRLRDTMSVIALLEIANRIQHLDVKTTE